MKLSRIRRSINKHIDRITLYILIVFYPITAVTFIFSKLIEKEYFQWVVIIAGMFLIMIASDATVRAKRRIRTTRGKTKREIKDLVIGASSVLPPLMAIGSAQHIYRKMASIENNPELISIIGYQPSKDGLINLDLLGSLWVILIAYIGKHYWDYFIELREESVRDKRKNNRTERQRKISEKCTKSLDKKLHE